MDLGGGHIDVVRAEESNQLSSSLEAARDVEAHQALRDCGGYRAGRVLFG